MLWIKTNDWLLCQNRSRLCRPCPLQLSLSWLLSGPDGENKTQKYTWQTCKNLKLWTCLFWWRNRVLNQLMCQPLINGVCGGIYLISPLPSTASTGCWLTCTRSKLHKLTTPSAAAGAQSLAHLYKRLYCDCAFQLQTNTSLYHCFWFSDWKDREEKAWRESEKNKGLLTHLMLEIHVFQRGV